MKLNVGILQEENEIDKRRIKAWSQKAMSGHLSRLRLINCSVYPTNRTVEAFREACSYKERQKKE